MIFEEKPTLSLSLFYTTGSTILAPNKSMAPVVWRMG